MMKSAARRLIGYIFGTKISGGDLKSKPYHCDILEYKHRSLLKMFNYLPYCLCGKIVKGFGRGSKDLGIPTANYSLDVVRSLPDSFKPGIYYGWANLDNGPVYKMVVSIGWNPFYENKEKSIETHVLHKFDHDLYGCLLKICIVGFLRDEKNFQTIDDLICRIKLDIEEATKKLESNESYKSLRNHRFFHASKCNIESVPKN